MFMLHGAGIYGVDAVSLRMREYEFSLRSLLSKRVVSPLFFLNSYATKETMNLEMASNRKEDSSERIFCRRLG